MSDIDIIYTDNIGGTDSNGCWTTHVLCWHYDTIGILEGIDSFDTSDMIDSSESIGFIDCDNIGSIDVIGCFYIDLPLSGVESMPLLS